LAVPGLAFRKRAARRFRARAARDTLIGQQLPTGGPVVATENPDLRTREISPAKPRVSFSSDRQTPIEAWQHAERDFITNAAHELQSPLAAILSAIEVLQNGAMETPDRDIFIDHVQREALRLDRVNRALLTLARAQTAVEAPRSELIDVCPMLEAIADRMEPAPGVDIVIQCGPELAVISNRELLEQAISNVVRNSVKYTEQGTIKLVAATQDSRIVIAVTDTGVGIPEEELPRVVERFYRADGSRDGFGLGLAIVQAAMEVLDGELEIESSVGYGTIVALSLPIRALRVTR
jgi:signal transduction histidine kinase